MKFYSPLRYPGGKGKIAKFFADILVENNLCDGTYIEPFAGGASVALALLFTEYVSKIIINDVDRSIFAFWYSVLNDTENLMKLIYDSPVDMETWKSQKAIQNNPNGHDLLSLGFSTFFLNRSNRSGILNAGPIGGKAQSGDWKMDARFNKEDLIKRIKKIALFKNRIEIYNEDAFKFIPRTSEIVGKNSLFYFDPPYYVQGKNLYLNHFNHKNHRDMSKVIQKVSKQNWIVTYDNISEIAKFYSHRRVREFSLNYSATIKQRAQELVIFSDNLKIPTNERFDSLQLKTSSFQPNDGLLQ